MTGAAWRAALRDRRARWALAALAALALVGGLVCARAGDGGPPDTLAELVPADALAYVHLSTDPERAEDQRFARHATALPPVTRLRDALAAAVAPGAFTLERDVRPWLGDEAAYAAVSPADSLLLAKVADRAGAERLVARIGNLSAASEHRGVQVLIAGPSALAFVRPDVLAVGTEAAVRAAIDRAEGEGETLAVARSYERATAGRPAERTLDLYASARGVSSVLAARGGLTGVLGALLERPGLEAVGAAVAAEERGLRVSARLAGGAPRDAAFEPLLLERVPEGAAAYLGLRGGLRLARLVERLAGRAAVQRLRRVLDREASVDLDGDLLAPLAGELALSVTGPGEDPEGTAAGAPIVTLKAQTADAARTEAALARAQQPLLRRLALPGTVPAPQVEQIGGADAQVLRLTPELAPSFTLPDGVLVLATAPAGLAPPRGTLASAEGFRATIGQVPEKADSLVFLDLSQLLALGEQTGLTALPGLGTARDDLARVRAAGAVVTEDRAHPSDTTAELFLEIP